MKKTLLIGSAVLSVLAAPGAHANPDIPWKPKPPSIFLPIEMLGSWCRDNDKNKWKTFHRTRCSDKYSWTIWDNGWRHLGRDNAYDSCTFTEIDKLDRYVYQVRGMCKAKRNADYPAYIPNAGMSAWTPSGNSVYEEVGELHLVDGALVFWRLPDV